MQGKTKRNGVQRLSSEQAQRLFNRQVRQALDMSGQEFIERWENGKIKNPDRPKVMRLAMMIPLGR